MSWTRAIRGLRGRPGRPSRAAGRRRPALECLEDRLTPSAQLSVFAGGGTAAASTTPTPATQVHLVTPLSPVADNAGNVYFADFNNNRVEKVDTAGNLTVIAGGGTTPPSATPTPATQVQLNDPSGVALDGAGNLYVVDSGSNLVERIDTHGNLVVIAGGGLTFPSTTPTPATQVQLNTPEAVAVDGSGNVYVTDSGNARLEKITGGNLVVVAGGGTLAPSTTPVAATQASIDPTRVAVDGSGNLYITDLNNINNQLVERVDAHGSLVVVAGGGTLAPSASPTPATQVKLNGGAVAVDGAGNVLIGDDLNHVIDRVDTAGSLTVIAGGGSTAPSTTPVDATQAAIVQPLGLTVDAGGNLYVADASNTRREVYKVADVAPVVPPINGSGTITLPHNQFPTTVALDASSPTGSPLTYSAAAAGYNPLFALEQQFRFQSLGVHTAGPTALVLQAASNNSSGNPFYLVRPSDGALFPYDGSGNYNNTKAGTPIATLGANVFTDPTLLVNAQPPVDYATLFNTQQQFQFTAVGQFTAGVTAFVLHSNQPGPGVAGFYLVRPADGALFPYDGSGNYNNTKGGTPLAVLGAGVFANPNLLLNAQAPPALYPQLQQLNQQFDLQEFNGSFYVNNLGHQAKWIYSPVLNQYGEHFYTLTLSPGGTQSVLRAWQGYPDSTVGAVVATFNTPAVYNNPQFLTTAVAVPNPPPSVASVDGSGNLTVSLPSAAFDGSFKVTVTVSDGVQSTARTVLVTATDTAPAFSVTQGSNAVAPGSTQTFAHGSFPQTFGVTTSDAEGDTVSTPAAAAASFSPLFALEQQFRFQSLGVHTAGATAVVLQAAGTNGFGNPFYLVRASDGGLFPYDGSGNYNNTTTGTPLTTLGALVYADPALLTNADAPVDYATLQGVQQQYQFTSVGLNTAGVTALVLHSSQPGPGAGGFYLVRTSDGALFPYDGSGSYNNTTTGTPLAVLGVDVVANPALLLDAKAAPALYTTLLQVEQQFDFQGVQFATAGAPAFVLKAALNNAFGNPFYLIRPSDGALFAYDGSGSYAHSFANSANLITVLDPSVYADPTLLTNAKAPLAAVGVTASLSGGVLTVNAPSAFVGTFRVTLSASDGILTGTQSFLVKATDTPPVPNAVPDQTASASGPALQIALGAADAEGDPVTFAAQAAGYSAAFNLQQQYHFQGLGYFTTPDNVTAYVLQIMGTNTNGNAFFLLKSDGGLYAFDGTANYGHTFANSANLIATLDPSVFTTPTLLTNANAPVTPPAAVSVSGSTLTVGVSGVTPGTVFQVFVTANDGAESRRISFLVKVSP